ncbi:lysostaphin resistance A-like protein [Pontibacillus salicampi]|uniref:Lysostaphin resistance A-like protein n=1 Tax=Pontibacillus salicampi TaxID=1449801 RepID=A0ABV6LTS6_9BACI
MPKRYWYTIVVYVLMQFSGAIGMPLLAFLFGYDVDFSGIEPFLQSLRELPGNQSTTLIVTWNLISFSVALIVILLLLRPDMRDTSLKRDEISLGKIVLWSVIGIFLSYSAQIVASLIELALGIPQASANTQNLMNIAKSAPIFIIIITIIAPILEELIFRKIIFGSIYKRTNFFVGALISSLIFAVVHQDLTHTLKYAAMGFVFAFLYVKTKRIIVPIIAHMAMNLIVVLIQFMISPEQLEQMEKQLENAQAIILGG